MVRRKPGAGCVCVRVVSRSGLNGAVVYGVCDPPTVPDFICELLGKLKTGGTRGLRSYFSLESSCARAVAAGQPAAAQSASSAIFETPMPSPCQTARRIADPAHRGNGRKPRL